MDSKVKETIDIQSEKKGVTSKKKKVLFWSLLSLAVAIVLAGVIIGIVLLSRNIETPPGKTDHEKWVDAIVDSNITNPGVSTEDLKIPSNVTLENIVYTSTLYVVVSSNDGEIIYKRNDSVSNPTIIDGFDYNNEFITYDKVVSIYGDYACVKNTSGNIQFIVDLNQEEAIYEVSGFKTIKFYNDICFAYSKSNGYPCLKAIDLKTKSLVLNISTPNNLSKIKFEEDYLLIVSDTNKTYYDYKVEGNSLKTIKSLDFVNKYVDSNYELKENEVKITYEGREFVVGKQSEVILATPNYILIENKIPTIDYLKANYVDEITYSSWDNELDVAIDNNVYYIVSYQLQNKSNNKITDFETEGMLSLTNDETTDFYYLEVTPFNKFDENGDTTLTVAERQSNGTLVVNNDFTQVFIYDAAKLGPILYYDGENYFTHGGVINDKGHVENKVLNSNIYKITSENVWNNNFIIKRNVYYGISDNHGNVVASTEFKVMSPIVNGYTVAYYDGHYYRLDLTNKTGHLLSNYYSEFHQYVLTGIGYYLEYDEDSKEYSMYTMDGTLKYDNISEIKILDFKSRNDNLKLVVNINNDLTIIEAETIDKNEVENIIDGYGNWLEIDSEIEADALIKIDELSEEEYFGTEKYNNETIVETPKTYTAINTSQTYKAFTVGYLGGGSKTHNVLITNSSAKVIDGDILNDPLSGNGLRGVFYERAYSGDVNGVYRSKGVDSIIPLADNVELYNHYYGDCADFDECDDVYNECWGTSGYAFGVGDLFNSSLYESGGELEFLAPYGGKGGFDVNIKKLLPTIKDTSTGELDLSYYDHDLTFDESKYNDLYTNDHPYNRLNTKYYPLLGLYLDGTLLLNYGENAVIAISRIFIDYKYSDGNDWWEEDDIGYAGYGSNRCYTYHVAIALIPGARLDEAFIGGANGYASKEVEYEKDYDWTVWQSKASDTIKNYVRVPYYPSDDNSIYNNHCNNTTEFNNGYVDYYDSSKKILWRQQDRGARNVSDSRESSFGHFTFDNNLYVTSGANVAWTMYTNIYPSYAEEQSTKASSSKFNFNPGFVCGDANNKSYGFHKIKGSYSDGKYEQISVDMQLNNGQMLYVQHFSTKDLIYSSRITSGSKYETCNQDELLARPYIARDFHNNLFNEVSFSAMRIKIRFSFATSGYEWNTSDNSVIKYFSQIKEITSSTETRTKAYYNNYFKMTITFKPYYEYGVLSANFSIVLQPAPGYQLIGAFSKNYRDYDLTMYWGRQTYFEYPYIFEINYDADDFESDDIKKFFDKFYFLYVEPINYNLKIEYESYVPAVENFTQTAGEETISYIGVTNGNPYATDIDKAIDKAYDEMSYDDFPCSISLSGDSYGIGSYLFGADKNGPIKKQDFKLSVLDELYGYDVYATNNNYYAEVYNITTIERNEFKSLLNDKGSPTTEFNTKYGDKKLFGVNDDGATIPANADSLASWLKRSNEIKHVTVICIPKEIQVSFSMDAYVTDTGESFEKISGSVGAIKVWDTDKKEYVRFSEDVDKIMNNFTVSALYDRPLLKFVKYYAEQKIDASGNTENMNEFYTLLSETDRLPSFEIPGYESNDFVKFYNYNSNTVYSYPVNKDDKKYVPDDVIGSSSWSKYITIAGVYTPTENQIVFKNVAPDGKTLFAITAKNGEDKLHSDIIYSDKTVNDTIDVPYEVYCATYDSTNKKMSGVQKLSHWLAEDGSIVETGTGQAIKPEYDKNVDGKMEFTPVFYSVDDTLFNYKVTYTYDGNQITGTHNIDDYISSEVIESVTAKVGGSIEIRLSTVYTKYIKEINFSLYTGNDRSNGSGKRYEQATFKYSIEFNPYMETLSSGDPTVTVKEWNTSGSDNGQSYAIGYDDLGNKTTSLSFDENTGEYIITISATQIGKIDTTENCWLGGIVEIVLANKVYNGGVEVS